MTPNEANERFISAKRQLIKSIQKSYGNELDGFLPQVLNCLRPGAVIKNPRHMLHLLVTDVLERGTPVFLDGPFLLHLPRALLAHLIMHENWLPHVIPPRPGSASADSDVEDGVAAVRAADEELRSLSSSREGKDASMPDL